MKTPVSGIGFLVSLLVLIFQATVPARAQSEAAPASSKLLPHMKLTRYLAPSGIESLSLSCHSQNAAEKEYFCDLVRERNGVEVAAVGMKASEIAPLLSRFFADLPREIPHFAPTENLDPVLGWEIRYENKTSQGSVPRFELEKSADVKRALFVLEAGLAAQFYK